jgi:hypothetical protein
MRRLFAALAFAAGAFFVSHAPAQADIPTLGSGFVDLTALNQAVLLNPLGGQSSCSLAVKGQPSFVGTLAFEVSVDGLNWAPAALTTYDGLTTVTTVTGATVGSGSFSGAVACGSAQQFRVRMSAFTSGDARVYAYATAGQAAGAATSVSGTVNVGNVVTVTGSLTTVLPYNAGSGQTPVAGTGLLVEGYDGTNVNSISTDATGKVKILQPDKSSAANTLALQTLNAAVSTALSNAEAMLGIQITGLTAQSATLTFEASTDGGTTWNAINAYALNSGAAVTTTVADNLYRINVGGMSNVRVRVSTAGNTTNATVSYTASSTAAIVPDPLRTNVTNTPSVNQGTSPWVVGGATSVAPQTGAAPSAANGNVVSYGHCIYSTTTPTPSTGNAVPCQMDANGYILITGNLTKIGGSAYALGPALAAAAAPVVLPKDTNPCLAATPQFANGQILVASGETKIITGAATKQTYICSITVGMTGTTPTFQAFQGTGTNCATSGSAISGVVNVTQNSSFQSNGANPWTATNVAADDTCLTPVGTSAIANYTVTYVQV